MDAPKCKLCDERHWSRERCKAQAAAPLIVPKVLAEDIRAGAAGPEVAKMLGEGKIAAAAPLTGFDRKAYIRNYMRQRRAKQRAQK